MCVVSAMGDHFRNKFENEYKWPNTNLQWPNMPSVVNPPPAPAPTYVIVKSDDTAVTREEFDALKKEIEEMKSILLVAKRYDEENNEPHCEMDEKVELLKKIAEVVGVNLDDVFGKAQEK